MTEDPSADVPASQEPDASPHGRAGRNLPAAIASGVVLAVLVVVSLLWWKWLFGVLAGVVILLALHELVNAFAYRDIKIARTPLYVAVPAAMVAAYLWGPTALLFVVGLAVVLILLWRIRRGTDGYVRDVTASMFALVYLPLMGGFTMLILAPDKGPQLIVTFIILTIGNDIGGYAAGVLFGRHPMAPQVSPKKSWEGFAGSVIVQALLGAGAFVWLLDAPWWQGVIVGVVLSVSATAGDLAESAVKRDLGVKDMGTLLPGHGGVMDRLDSLVVNAFVAWALFTLFF
jgi:phosphatidate cytidylyltransferase